MSNPCLLPPKSWFGKFISSLQEHFHQLISLLLQLLSIISINNKMLSWPMTAYFSTLRDNKTHSSKEIYIHFISNSSPSIFLEWNPIKVWLKIITLDIIIIISRSPRIFILLKWIVIWFISVSITSIFIYSGLVNASKKWMCQMIWLKLMILFSQKRGMYLSQFMKESFMSI